MALATAVSLSLMMLAAASQPGGVIVEEVQPGFSAHHAGLKPGDLLLGWERAASPPANPDPAQGEIHTTFNLAQAEREQAPRGELTLRLMRDGQPLRIRVPPGDWKLEARPALADADAATYEAGKKLLAAGERDRALTVWSELAARLRTSGDQAGASWVFLRSAGVAAKQRNWESAEPAFAQAVTAAQALGDTYAVATIHAVRGESFREGSQWDRSVAAYNEALAAHRARGAPTLAEAWILSRLGRVAGTRGDLAAAEEHQRRALAMRQELAPRSADVAASFLYLGINAYSRGELPAAEEHYRRALALYEELGVEHGIAFSLNNLGLVAENRGDLAAAEEYYTRVLAMTEPQRGQTLEFSYTLQNLGIVAKKRGNLATAEELYRRALELQEKLRQPLDVANNLHNLGGLALGRGDLDAAEDYGRRAVVVREEMAPQSLELGSYLTQLGMVARERGNLASAEQYLRSALAIKERVAADSLGVCFTLNVLAKVAIERGDLEQARQRLQRALAIEERLGPNSEEAVFTQLYFGDVALAGGKVGEAAHRYQRALELAKELAPGRAREAEPCHRLAALHRRQRSLEQAWGHYRCALDALEAQRGRLGGTDEVKAGFAARYASFYREAIDLLVEMGRAEDAFHVLERYRARGLLALLAERDLVFSADLPPELDRERRSTNAEYDRTLALLGRAKATEVEKLREGLAAIRRRQAAVQDKIRATSPRLAALQYPEPLDLGRARATMDPGTLLLSYSVGEPRSYVFAVGPGAADFKVVALDLRLEDLRADVAQFRQLIGRPGVLGQRQLERLARRLGDRLLRPVAQPIARAERLLIIPDGPLHLLPFAALADPTSQGRHRYLAAAKPVHIVASATVFAELKRSRRPERTARLVAFADPDYSAVASGDRAGRAAPELVAARQRGLDLRPLPAARREVEAVKGLYSGAAQVYLGSEATEERAKAMGAEGSLVHFACHARADETSPLDSYLALSLPREWRPGRDNGLLQAWEVFEQVRIDADLVTLSACSTALGREMSGEGMLGLSRAFQYAGARSVLASLWKVDDASTAELMTRFYGHLQRGGRKDAALRAAQLEMLRRRPSSHPYHWAAFQLIGDGE